MRKLDLERHFEQGRGRFGDPAAADRAIPSSTCLALVILL